MEARAALAQCLADQQLMVAEAAELQARIIEVQADSVEDGAQVRAELAHAHKAQQELKEQRLANNSQELHEAHSQVLELLEKAAAADAALAEVEMENAALCTQLAQAQQHAVKAQHHTTHLESLSSEAQSDLIESRRETQCLSDRCIAAEADLVQLKSKLVSSKVQQFDSEQLKAQNRMLASELIEAQAYASQAEAENATQVKNLEHSDHVARAALDEARSEVSRLIGRLTEESAVRQTEVAAAAELAKVEIQQLKQQSAGTEQELKGEIRRLTSELNQQIESEGASNSNLLEEMQGRLEESLQIKIVLSNELAAAEDAFHTALRDQAELTRQNCQTSVFVSRHKRDIQILNEQMSTTKREMRLQAESHQIAINDYKYCCIFT
jgi:IS1 family transposase